MRNIEQAYKNVEAVYSGLTKKQRGRFIGYRLRLALGHLRDELKSNQEYPITRTTRGGDYYPQPITGGNLDKKDRLFDFILRFLLIKK